MLFFYLNLRLFALQKERERKREHFCLIFSDLHCIYHCIIVYSVLDIIARVTENVERVCMFYIPT